MVGLSAKKFAEVVEARGLRPADSCGSGLLFMPVVVTREYPFLRVDKLL